MLNNRALLDQEGEVVCTNIGENEARVSYISPEGLEDKSPVVGSLKVLLDISHCNHITLAGLNFRHSTSGGQEGPYAWGAESAVRLTHVEDVLLDDCEFSHLGMIGVYVQVVNESIRNTFIDLKFCSTRTQQECPSSILTFGTSATMA